MRKSIVAGSSCLALAVAVAVPVVASAQTAPATPVVVERASYSQAATGATNAAARRDTGHSRAARPNAAKATRACPAKQ